MFNEKDINVGISVNDGYGVRFTDLILSGKKTIETRTKRTLDPFIGEWVGLIRTGVGKAMLVGYIKLGEPISYNGDDFEKDYDRHYVNRDNKKFFAEGKKFGYPIIGVKKIEPRKLDVYRPINRYQKSTGEVFNVAQYVARDISSKNVHETRLDIDKIISESIRHILNESASSILYHYMNIENLYKLLNKNAFRTCDPEKYIDIDSGVYRDFGDSDKRFMSLTRNGNPGEGYPILKMSGFGDGDIGCVCRLTLDGNALNTYCNFKDKKGKQKNFKVKPIDWAYRDGVPEEAIGYNGKTWMMYNNERMDSPSYHDDMLSTGYDYCDEYNDKYHHSMSQAEDRLTTTEEYIPNASRYIKQIDIVLRDKNEYKDQETQKYITKVQRLAKQLSIPINVYEKNLRYMQQSELKNKQRKNQIIKKSMKPKNAYFNFK